MSFFAVERCFMAKLKIVYAILVIYCLLIVLIGTATGQSRRPTDGFTPTGMEVGAPAGAYPLSGFDTINLFNGYLNIDLPLYQIGGRGSAGYTIRAHVTRDGWEIRKDFVPISGGGYDQVLTPVGRFSQAPLYGPLRLIGVHTSDSGLLQSPDCNSGSYPQGTLTRLKVITDDGTELFLIDEQFQGMPKPDNLCSQSPSANRGRVFRTRDGGSMTFMSDDDISDSRFSGFHEEFNVSVVLLTKDGTRYRIDGGYVSWMRDRNGNKIDFIYQTVTPFIKKLISVMDSLKRQVTITYATGAGTCDVLSYKGFGSQVRPVKVCYNQMATALRPDFTIKTGAELFPEINYYLYPPPYNDASWTNNPVVISYVELPDNRKYQFLYNSYGEVARVIPPTGGGYDYDYTPSGSVVPGTGMPGNVVVLMVYRRLSKKTIYNALTPTTDPTSPPAGTVEKREKISAMGGTSNYPSIPATIVTVEDENFSGTIQTQSKHYFYGSPTDEAEALCPPLNYSLWYSGREYRTESYEVVNGVVGAMLQKLDTNWSPTLPGSHVVCPTDVMHPIVPPDPRVGDIVTTIDSNQVSKKSFTYDQYNNQTDVYEYDFGSGSPPAYPTRHTHIDYLTTNPVNGVNYATDTNIHIRSLTLQQIVYAVDPSNGAETWVAQTKYEYDRYDATTNHAALVNRSNISGLDSSYTTGYTTRGNVTQPDRWLNSSGSSVVSTWAQYDIAGN